MLTKFAITLLNDVADECELRAYLEPQHHNLFIEAAEKITDIVESLVELPEDDD